MTPDPRNLNKTFSAENLQSYLKDYVSNLQQVLTKIDTQQFEKILAKLGEVAASSKKIYVCGNGGSAAIADHLCCDWSKGTHFTEHPAIKTHSLASNTALFTACANDFGYEKSFSAQIEMFGAPGEVLLAISSSGNSPNILHAVSAAREKGMTSIGFCGFSGGKLKSAADLCLHVPFDNYGLVEDAHQILMHVLAQFFTLGRTVTGGAGGSAREGGSGDARKGEHPKK